MLLANIMIGEVVEVLDGKYKVNLSYIGNCRGEDILNDISWGIFSLKPGLFQNSEIIKGLGSEFPSLGEKIALSLQTYDGFHFWVAASEVGR